MTSRFLNIRNIFILILSVLIIISFFTLIFKKEYKVPVIKNIDQFAFNDSIIYVRYYKDDNGPGIETRLKGYDTSFCFSGRSDEKNTFYFEFAKKGDVIVKEKNANVFFIKRNDITISFILSKCN